MSASGRGQSSDATDRRWRQPVRLSYRGALALTALAAVLIAPSAIAGASDVGSPGLPDPQQAARAGLPVLPDPLARDAAPAVGGVFPFTPLDSDPTEGIRHGWVQTSSGRFDVEIGRSTLTPRPPSSLARGFDAETSESIAAVPVTQDARPQAGTGWGAE